MFTNVSSSKNFIDFSVVVICVKGFSIYHSGFSNQLIVNCEQMLEELDEYRPWNMKWNEACYLWIPNIYFQNLNESRKISSVTLHIISHCCYFCYNGLLCLKFFYNLFYNIHISSDTLCTEIASPNKIHVMDYNVCCATFSFVGNIKRKTHANIENYSGMSGIRVPQRRGGSLS